MTKRTDASIEKQIIEMYTTITDNGWIGCNTIADKYGIAVPTVQNILIRNGVKLRSSAEAYTHGKRTKPIKNIPMGDAPICKCGCGMPVDWNRRKNKWDAYRDGHYRKNFLYKSKEWLSSEYQSGKTLSQIAKQFGVAVSAVRKFAVKFGIEIRAHGDTLKLLGSMKGSKNPAWNGGTTPERQRAYKTVDWIQLVKYIYKRDGYKCQRCGTEKVGSVKFHAHHIRPWSLYPDLRLEPSNLVTLCDTCHRWVHSRQNLNLEYLAK